MRRVAFAIVCALSVAGCATITSIGDWDRPGSLKTASGYYSLPRTVLNVKVTGSAATAAIIVASAAEPDPQAPILFRIEHSPLSQDEIQVVTGTDGLLTSISSSATDKTGDIAVAIAKLVFSTQTGGSDANARSLPAVADGALPGFSASYDPFDDMQSETVRASLEAAGFCIRVGHRQVMAGLSSCFAQPTVDPIPAIVASHTETNPGIYYRRLRPAPIEIFKKDPVSKKWSSIFVGNEQFFDKSLLYRVDMDRVAFTKRKIDITFERGVLKDIKLDNPSELFGLAGYAVQVAQIIFAIPLAGFKQDKELVDAQTNLLTSQGNLIKAQQSLLTLQTKAATDGRTLLLTPNYSESGRALELPNANFNVGTTDPDKCMLMWKISRERCIAAINRDVAGN